MSFNYEIRGALPVRASFKHGHAQQLARGKAPPARFTVDVLAKPVATHADRTGRQRACVARVATQQLQFEGTGRRAHDEKLQAFIPICEAPPGKTVGQCRKLGRPYSGSVSPVFSSSSGPLMIAATSPSTPRFSRGFSSR
jgi:hypothetical protein